MKISLSDLLIPAIILGAAGWWGYSTWSAHAENAKAEQARLEAVAREDRALEEVAPRYQATRALTAGARAVPRLTFRTARPLDAALIATLPGVVSHEVRGDGWSLSTREVNRSISGLVQKLEANGNEMLDLQIHRPSLEDVFMELTGQTWTDSRREESDEP